MTLHDGDRPVTYLKGSVESTLARCDAALGADGENLPLNSAGVHTQVEAMARRGLRVEALQARGEVVAMTGDGVNDAPAWRRANIGVAMGINGTEVSKEAADMVLTDDNFATIEAAVEEGRGVFANLIKFATWILPINAGQGLLIIVAVMAAQPLPVLPVQALWINMTTGVPEGYGGTWRVFHHQRQGQHAT